MGRLAMGEDTYPTSVTSILATLVEIFERQDRPEIVELLKNAHAGYELIEHNSWNGGTTTWSLRLELPIALFASIEPRLSKVKEEIDIKLRVFNGLHTNDFLNMVEIFPILAGTTASGQRMTPSESDVRRLWDPNKFRLFASHVSQHKVEMAAVKLELSYRGVDAFLAHEKIEPSLEWQSEIELGLRSMHALAAFITPGFHESLWTDQEVGYALGLSVLVLPIRLGMDPYGFAAKIQAITGRLEDPSAMADQIVRSLLISARTHREMRRALVAAFSDPLSFVIAKALQRHLATVEDFTDEDKASLYKACAEHSQVKGALGVVDAVYAQIGKPPGPKDTREDDIPF